MNYKELMESKLNTTMDNRLNSEIKTLEKKLKNVEREKKDLTVQLSRVQDSFDCSMIKSTMQGEQKVLKAEERNAQLMEDLIKAKKKIRDFEKNQKNGGNSSSKNDPMQNLNNLTHLFPEDTSFFNGGGFKDELLNPESEKNIENSFKTDLLHQEINELKSENSKLIQQIQSLRSELKDKEDTESKLGVVNKLKQENKEIRKVADSLLEKNKKLFEEKNELRKKIDGLADRSIMEPSKVEDLEFKAKTLE